MGGQSLHQFQALFWKNWLCRLRQPVLSLSEFLWPCTLFLILTVIRFQEPPRHRDNCYLQPRNLPSQGVYPFVQSLLCNAGSRCKNTSYAVPKDSYFRISRSPSSQDHQGMGSDLVFLEDIQELAQGISETMEKAVALQKLWIEDSKLSGSHNSAFSMEDLNKTETLISKIEYLHHQPYFWNFLHLLPGLRTSNSHPEYGLQVLAQFLQTILSSLVSLEDLDWLPINKTFSKAAKIGLNVTIMMLEFLQEEKVEVIGPGYNLSLRNVVWNPLKLKSDLTSKYGFDDLRVEKMLNYTRELNEIPTDSSLEQFICSALFNTSEVEADNNYNHGNCNIYWSEAKDYLVHSVSKLQIYKQVIHQWLNATVIQKILTGMEQSLALFIDQYPEDSELWKVASVLHTMIHLLDDSLGPNSLPNYLQSPKILVYLAKFQTILQNLPHWPTVKRLLLVNGALRNVIIKNLHFIQEVLSKLERLAPFSETNDLSSLQLEMDTFFRDLKQMLTKNYPYMNQDVPFVSEENLTLLENSKVMKMLTQLRGHPHSSNETIFLYNLLRSIKEADGIFHEVLLGQTNWSVATIEDFLGWQAIEEKFAESTTFCSWLYQSLSTQLSPGEDIAFVYCQEKITSTLVFHTLEEIQFALEQNNSWKNVTEFFRKTCEFAHYVNKQESLQRNVSATSEKSPCNGAKPDWKAITDTYFVFLKNLYKSPRMSMSWILMYTKDLLEMEQKSHSYEDEITTFWLSFVDFIEKMILPRSLVSFNPPIFQNLANLTEVIWNKTLWWINTSKSSEAELPSLTTKKLSELSKDVIEKIQVVSRFWKRNEYEGFLRILELILYEINPKLLELWMYGIPKREKDKLETLSTLLNLSIPENLKVLRKNFSFSLNFHNLSESENLNLDFIHLSEIVINSLHELGSLTQEQVTAALNTVYALRNISMLSSSFSVSQKQYLENILTQIYQNVFQDKDSVVLLRLYSSIYQDIYQFISSFQSRESLLTYFIQISKTISAIMKEFKFEDIHKAFEFLSEVTSFLDRISEESLCEKLFSVYNYLELQVKSLIPKEGQETKMIHVTMMSLKQLLIRDTNFKMSLLHYLNQLFNNSGHLDNQCFYLDDRLPSLNWSVGMRNFLILPWIQMLSNLTENIAINESLAMQCTFSWVQVWYEIWGNMSQILKFDSKFFSSLQFGLRKLSSQLGNSSERFEACQTAFPDHIPIRLIKRFLKILVQDEDAGNWNALASLSSVLDNSVTIMTSLNTEKVEKSLLTLENTMLKLKEFPLNINISRKFFYSLFEVFMELSNATRNIDRNSLTGSGEEYEIAFTVLQETTRFLGNMSYNQYLLSCSGILQNITNLIMESDLALKNTSQKLLSVLTILNSILTSEDIISRLESCSAWIDIIRNLGIKYNTTSLGHSQDFLESFLSSRNVNGTKTTVRNILDFVTFILNSTKPLCPLNNSDMHCLAIYFRNVTNFVKIIITSLFEKEKMPMLDFVSMILNNSEDHIRVVIDNLPRTLENSSDIILKNFTELIIRALKKSDNSSNQFQIVWLESIAFLREIQKLVKNITIKILENNTSDIRKVLKVFMNLPIEKSANLLGDSIQNLGSYFAFNFSHDLQNSSIHAIMKAIGLDIQLARDVMNSLLPSVLSNIPQNSGNMKVLKKISTLVHNLKNADIELLVDQLEEISGSLWDFLKNISALENGNSGIDLLIGLMKTFVHSSHSWNVNHLWQLSRLFPKDEVDAVVDAYYMLPNLVRLLQRIAYKNITETLLEVYNFTLAHGISIFTVTKKDFANAIKGLLDITELVIEKPNIAAEALSCLPITWCSNHSTVQLRKDKVMEKCNIHKSGHPLLYSKMTDLFYHLQLMPLEEDLQCSNESLKIETTHRVYCFFHELAAWNSILMNFSEVFHVNNSLLKELQRFWYKVSPYILSSEKSSNVNDSIHCTVVPGKWIALRVIAKLKKLNFTRAFSVKNVLEQFTSLNKIHHWNVDKETSILNKTITNLKRWTKLVSSFNVENLTLSPSVYLYSKAKQMNDFLKILLSFDRTSNSNITDNLETLWPESEKSMQELWKTFSIKYIFSSFKQAIQIIKSLPDQNTTLPLSYFLKQFNSSLPHETKFLENLTLLTKDLLQAYTNGNFSTIIDTLVLVLTNESFSLARTLVIDDITNFLEHFKNISREGNINVTFFAHLLNLEKQANFSVAQFLFESSQISAINNFVWSSLEAALNFNDTNLPIIDFIDLVFNYIQFENNKGNLSLHPSSTMELFKQFFQKFFFLPKGEFENKTSALLEDLYTHIIPAMSSTIRNMTHQQLEKAIPVALNKIALWMEWLLLHRSQWRHSTKALLPLTWETSVNVTTEKGVMPKLPNNIKREKNDFPLTFKPSSCFEKSIKRIVSLAKYWQKGPLQNQSVLEICQFFQKYLKPSTASTLQKVKMTVLNVLIILSEDPSFTKDILCTFMSCKDGLIRHLLSIVQGVILVHGHYQDFENIWSSTNHGHCEELLHISSKLSNSLESLKRSLRNATARDCECYPMLETVNLHMQMLARSLEKPLSGNPIMAFLSNFSVTRDVRVKDCVQNVTKLTEELHSLTTISEETINNILEANISHSKFFSSALTVVLAGKCDEEVISTLLTFPADGKALAARELCVLPASDLYALIVLISQNLDLRITVYKLLIPPEANFLLNSLLDVVSSIDSLLTKAQHILKHLPEFLQKFKNIPLFDMPAFSQFPQDVQSRSSTFGSLQSVMKMVCKEEASFLSNSNMFINLPRVNDLLEDDKIKFNIPKDSTPFCLKLYQEILQSPNGALVWAFLKPLLHGKILYTPNTPVINKVIEKANYTFDFVDKLKIVFEAMLKMSSIFQNGGNAEMINHLQEALRNKFIKNFVESQLQIDMDKLTEKLHNYTGMLGKMFNHSKAEQFHSLAQIMVNISSCVLLNRFQPLESVEILEREAHGLMQQNNLLASIIFNSSITSKKNGSDFVDLPHHFIYTIRTSVLYSMRTDLVKNPLWKFHPQSLPADGFKYNHIFVPLQDMIERAIILVQTGLDTLTPPIQAQAMPYPCHTSDLFLNNVGFFFPLIMMLTWMVSVASMVRKLVYEREIRLEEYMKMMGVHPIVHFLAWFLENIIMIVISSCALAIILKTSGIFAHSNAFIIFLFLLDFGISIVMLSFLLSAFFSSANTAALCTSLVYMISFLPYIVLLVLHNQLSFAIETVLCFLSTTAFGQGVFFITFLEGQEAGIQWNNMYQYIEQEGDMTFGWVCWMILFDSMAYFICGWYFSNLIPGDFGLKKPWYFPFTMSYWQNLCDFNMKKQQHINSNLLFFNENFMNKGSLPPNRQITIEDRVHTGVTLVSVTKEYEGDKKAAVKELTLTFYKGQITALLGPNGAGKTTIISLLTGLYPPNSGTIIINGKDMQTQLAAIRMEMGVCPQYDVLFDNLSVREHLLLFASIKAPLWTKKQLYQQVDKTLQDMELTHHQHKHIRALSGGTKRKLSIGIAFIGNSNVIVLDEPTSGVDPCARRGIWDILLKYRAGRTLIFTTHHLDEAEVLSDRIAILQHGQLRCAGSPSSLKETYGHGLSLTLTKKPFVLEIQDAKDIDRVTSLIQIYIPKAFLKENGGNELTYVIPKDTDKTCFKGLFQALDQNLHQLHLTGYGISDTTLEEVFLKLLQDSKNKPYIPDTIDIDSEYERSTEQLHDNNDSHWKTKSNRGGKLLFTQMAALLTKRFHHTRRGWKGTLSDLLLPVLFVALAMGLFMVKPLVTDYPSLKLTPGHYDTEEAYFFSSESEDAGLSNVLLRSFSVQDPSCANFNLDLKNFSCWRSDPFLPKEFQDSCGCLRCPKENTSAPYLKNSKGHTLFNLSAFDVEEYLLWPSKKPRLGGWSFGVRIPNQGEDSNINMSKSQTLAKVWYNQKGFHALPSYLNHLNNLVLWQHLPPSVNWRQYGITLYSHPYGGTLLNEDKILESVRQCGVALCIMLGFSILTASIGSSVVKDRVCGAKRLQHISGLGYRTYWFTNFIYDMLFYLVSVSLSIAVIVAFQLTAFTFRENLAATALLLAFFGYATLPWMYLLSRIFSSSDVAFISYISLNFIFGLCTMLMTIMPRLLAVISKAQNLQNIYNVLKWVFTIFPQFCLGQGLIELCYNQIKFDLTHNFGIDSYVSPFEMNFLGWIYVAMALQGTTFLLLRILLHWDLLQKPRSHPIILGPVNPSEDMDVKEEQMRIWTGRTNSDILVLRSLRKSYQSFGKRTIAVNDITLGIPRGECFGLLGVNGAGKSTTFKMLTGDITPSSGYAVIRNPGGDEMILSSSSATDILIGYCPQKDALDEFLTGWEHLHYYCSLRGVPKQDIHRVAGELVHRLHLETHIEKPVNTYSGGTKRKLSTALALVGKPEILLLDEPSSGMDPGSKRYLWKTIMKEVQEGCAAVLTSHSMEECEALCTRLAIMVDGSFKCLGSPRHIKNRFGAGYTVKVWLSQATSQHNAISDSLKLHFPGIQFKGQHLNLLEYHVPQRCGCLADLFKVLENNKTLMNIKHYSINQTTLEQVFISFATQQ
ncbi:LOW QUALITY PROTEIN: ATP-binding cassette sub-family A member 13 [Sminthopsis crassicaudata]|uniref:LOW QUALITY PROTEIN: ATP-binding cassette sub-family A member 13 n=1 Tax=Sminthopsis crassicaudata TaxID=9301 RepID=UPI003D685BBA